MLPIYGTHEAPRFPPGGRLPAPQGAPPRPGPPPARAGGGSGGGVRSPPRARRPPQEPRRGPERPRRCRRARGGAVARPRPPAVIVADTGAVVALVDADDRSHRALRAHLESGPGAWGVPRALPAGVGP